MIIQCGRMKQLKFRMMTLMIMAMIFVAGCSSADKWLDDKVGQTMTKEESGTEVEKEAETDSEAEPGDKPNSGEESVEKSDEDLKKATQETNEPLSYLRDTVNDYAFKSDDGIHQVTYVGEYGSGDMVWDQWADVEDETSTYLLMENAEGTYTGFIESEYYEDIVYPVEKDKEFGNDYTGFNTITDVNLEVQTPAGMFEDVVEVSNEYGSVYYAPNVGVIKSFDEHGEVVSELVEIIPQQ